MTFFVSLGPNYGVQICPDQSVPRGTRNGLVVNEEVQPLLIAQFRLAPIAPFARYQALQWFRKRHGRHLDDAYYHTDDVLTEPTHQPDPTTGSAFVAFRPENSFGAFDTGKLGPPGDAEAFIYSWKGRFEVPDPNDPDNMIHMTELYDRELRASPDYGRDFVEIVAEKIPLPWPSYDLEQGPGKHDRIAKIVEATGIDPALVIAYEESKGENASKGVVKRMEDLMRETAAQAATDDAFKTTVPV